MSEDTNSSMVGDWLTDFSDEKKNPKSTDKKKPVYLDTKAGGQFRVRLIGSWVKCLKRFDPYRCTIQENEMDTDLAYKAGFKAATKRCAINVIDRADGKIKILEKGSTVFKHFSNYRKITGKDPAGVAEGPDFVITVSGTGTDTEYGVVNLDNTPLTEAEKNMIKEQKLWPLKDLYRSTPADKIKEMWDKLSPEKRTPPVYKKKDGTEYSRSSAQPTQPNKPIEEKVEAPSTVKENTFDDDPAGGEGGEDSTNLF